MQIRTETFWNPARAGGRVSWAPDILLNGELGIYRDQDDGCRTQYRFPRQGLLMKMESGDYQSKREHAFWQNLPSYLRSVFTPCLGVGTLEPWTTVIEDWQGKMLKQVWSTCSFTLAPWYSDLKQATTASGVIQTQVRRIANELNVGDFGIHQWKLTRFGTPIIHDYGYADSI